MPDFRRWRAPGATYFFTLCLADPGMDHLTRHVVLLRACFRSVMASRSFRIDAISILPDHLHMVVTLPPGDDDCSTRIRMIKGRFSSQLPAGVAEVPRPGPRKERGIWQRRFWEHLIRDEQDLDRHIGYCHWDPVRHGSVKAPEDWVLSSIHRNMRLGLPVGKLGPVPVSSRIKFGERLSVARVD